MFRFNLVLFYYSVRVRMLLGGFSIIFGGIPLNFEDMKNIIMGISKNTSTYSIVSYIIKEMLGVVRNRSDLLMMKTKVQCVK